MVHLLPSHLPAQDGQNEFVQAVDMALQLGKGGHEVVECGDDSCYPNGNGVISGARSHGSGSPGRHSGSWTSGAAPNMDLDGILCICEDGVVPQYHGGQT